MKLKKTDINLLIMLAGVLIAVASYCFVYTSYNEKTATIEADNAVLATEVEELQKLADNKEHYIKETERMNNEINEIIAQYPAEVRAEDQIMYAVGLENTNAIWVNSMEMGNTELMQVASAAPQQDAVTEATDDAAATEGDAVVTSAGMQDTVFLYRTPYKYAFKVTYRSIKDIVSSVVTSDEKMNLSSMSLAYDADTGCLVGSMDMSMYTMSGTGKYYEELSIPGVSIGTNDFFQSGTVLNINTGILNDTVDEENAESDGEDTEETSEEEGTEE